jgi:S-adenosylmethionine-diacylgycerolhomoserine-N-methlytransferase
MDIQPGDRVLEMGCGTARNMVLLARRQPQAMYYGIDASSEMLVTAQKKAERAGLQDRMVLRQCLAEEVSYQDTFGLDEPFDWIFFSYALSMIPTWKQSIQTAMDNLKPGGWIYIVDFWDQAKLPGWFQGILRQWLALFHVRHEPELLDYLHTLAQQNGHSIQVDSILGQYALKTRLQKPVI